MDEEALKTMAREFIALMKNLGIFGKDEGKWSAGIKLSPSEMQFADEGLMNDFQGVFFGRSNNGVTEFYYNPPHELKLEHDDDYDENIGIWKKAVPKAIQAAKSTRTLVETGISAPKSSSELRSWDSRKISRYLLGEAENYEALYACIIAQLENVDSAEARNAIDQLTALMETTTESVPKTKKAVKKYDEDDLANQMSAMSMKAKARSPSPKKSSPKARSPSPKKSSPKKSSPLKGGATEEQLVEQYERLSAEKDDVEKKLSSTASALVRKKLNERIAKLNIQISEIVDLMNKLGFGRTRLQANRRMSRRRSMKKTRKTSRRTSKIKTKRKARRSGRSMKRNKRRTSKSKIIKKGIIKKGILKKGFGSTIYGLQGGMQNGPIYPGVYPMTLKVNEALPNLNNVKRTYSVNGFGAGPVSRRRRNSPPTRRRSPHRESKINDDEEGEKIPVEHIAKLLQEKKKNLTRRFGSCGCDDDE